MSTEASQMGIPDPGPPTPAGLDIAPVGPPVTERPAASHPGLQMLLLGIVILIIGAVLVAVSGQLPSAGAAALLAVGILVILGGGRVLCGLTGVFSGRYKV